MIGIGAMIAELSGNDESAALFGSSIGKIIASLSLSDDALHFTFNDGTKMRLVDAGQSCCESRYMRTDDSLADYVGATLTRGIVKSGPDAKDPEAEVHEVQFLEIQTSKGAFVMANHNEHNGYYGGFAILAEAE